jgi:hypothetical protein
MHSTETINQFLNLRAQGWSFARIADHLHVSKPTLLDWSRKHQSELEAMQANQERSVQSATQPSHKEFPPSPRGEGQPALRSAFDEGGGSGLQLEHLTLFHTTLRQELIKRTLQTLSDDEIQTMADAIEHQIEKLRGQPSVAHLAKEGKETR